ncbi:MAG: PAS domain S-box protein [Nitrospira sp.]|nr:PAS domain S-box protein [Nitrospira sp.]
MTISASEEKIQYLNEHTDFAKTIFDGLLGYAVIAADFDGTIIAFNAGASLIYGYTQEEVIGRQNLESIFPHDFKKTGGVQGIIDNLMKNGISPIEVENIRKSGETFPVKMVLTLVRSKERKELGFVSIVQELTGIRQAEDEIRKLKQFMEQRILEAQTNIGKGILTAQFNQFLEQKVIERTAQLQQSEARFRVVAESAGDAIICLNKIDTIYLWNKKAEEIFGYSAVEAIGKSLHQFIVPERYRSDAETGLKIFLRSGTGPMIGNQVEVSALKKDGSEFPVELTISAMKAGDEWYAIGIIRDISERKQAENKLKEYIAELERFKKATIQREFRIKELKEKLESLEKK